MTARTTPQQPGTPTWLDFWTKDPEATAAFWRDQLGYDIPPGSEQFGGYTVAQRDGRYVFGIGPEMPGSTHDLAALYLATDDVDATLAKVTELGGEIVQGATDIPEHGRMAVIKDPAGVQVALWQANGVVGYAAVDEPGFPCWQDCISSDVERSAKFYCDLFGFTTEEWGPGALVAKLGEDNHFTIGPAGDREPHWVSYLLVDDLDAAVAKAEGAGATVTKGATELPFGRFAHLTTPGGAPFGYFQANGEDPQA